MDAIDLHTALVVAAPSDIADWPVTTRITRLEMRTPDGLLLTFSALRDWPDYTPPNWAGPMQYTVWPVVNIAGRWVTSGIVQMWRGRPNTGAPILTDFAKNWVYDSRWAPMTGHQPIVGEAMGFFVSAGNARGENGGTFVRERSNVVLVNLPAGDVGSFTFDDVPIVVPTPPPTPPPNVGPGAPPIPPASDDELALLASIDRRLAALEQVQAKGLTGKVFGQTVTFKP